MDLLDLIEAEKVTRAADPDTAARVMLVADDRVHATDRERVVAAILADADTHGGRIDPNRVRAALTHTDDNGKPALTVQPQVLSAAYMALKHRRAIAADGYTTNDDRAGGNHGKPLRLYRLTDREAAA